MWMAAGAFGVASQRQVQHVYLADALAPLPDTDMQVSWHAPNRPLSRPLSDAERLLIGRAFAQGFRNLALAQEAHDPLLLVDHFTGIAAKRAALSVTDAKTHGGRMVVLSHNLTPTFFHPDGSLFQAKTQMLTARFLPDTDGGLRHVELTRDTGTVTFRNGLIGWRIWSFERRGSTPVTRQPAPWTGRMNGINYYPAATPWRAFWPRFDANQTAADLDRITGLGADTIRIFLQREAFLGPDAATHLAHLETLLGLARERGLRVVPTLFDLKGDYGLATWPTDRTYLRAVLPVLTAFPNVELVDLKNEPDLDFATHGRAKVEAWISTMSQITGQIAPALPQTVGWSHVDAAPVMADQLDVLTYHDYADIAGTAARLTDLRTAFPDHPVLVTEIGASTFGLLLGQPGSPTSQARKLDLRMRALKDADGVFIWTLYDFPNVDPSVVGRSPWVRKLQSGFGLLRADGGEKPAAAVIRRHFGE
ncbi:hypothetical protein ACMU_07860 [Actibacterium mucosum KCTC 23349]|uniref:Glycoside hydrolase family 5 domain-containing protein n=2 Tax=Actibacterium TaxID=1433986 RepID=A0A037ZMH5_9RHOB|nr:hypothetical protein ACMU_07860 [Actibacterium mucosum KCTC 23349]